MAESQEPTLSRSGQPPSPSDSDEDSDQGETSSSPMPTVPQQENLERETNRDPPAAGDLAASSESEEETGGRMLSEEGASQDAEDDHRRDADTTTAQHHADTTSPGLPRGTDDAQTGTGGAVEATGDKHDPIPEEATRGDHSPRMEPASQIEKSQLSSEDSVKEESLSDQQQEEVQEQMAPNMNILSEQDQAVVEQDQAVVDVLPEEVKKSSMEKEQVISSEEEKTSISEEEKKHDDKKPEERNDSTVTPPPPDRRLNGAFVSTPKESIGALLHHPQALSAVRPAEQVHMPPPQHMPMSYGYPMAAPPPYAAAAPPPVVGGRRKIRLRLEEDVRNGNSRASFFTRLSHRRINSLQSVDSTMAEHGVDRGSVTVSWFEGTTSAELQQHVRKTVIRKMGLQGDVKLADMRILDESMDPPEEIVLSPFIPNGSRFLLRFSTKERQEESSYSFAPRQYLKNQIASTAPDSPSAAPSPHPSSGNLLNLNEAQLQMLGAKLKELQAPSMSSPTPDGRDVNVSYRQSGVAERAALESEAFDGEKEPFWSPPKKVSKMGDEASKASTDFNDEEVLSMHPDDQIEARLRQLTDLLVNERRGKREKGAFMRRQEKKQVIFVMANYFVLFLSVVAIMAEIQSRAPRWLEWAERNLENVQTCATDQESLFQCVSNGDLSGLIASFLLWFGRSAATRRFFLFGFETPKRLWTAVYEALVTAFCWGISYMFIRRGMNPDTRQNFLHKYWKDAVYGSLAGFNASFLKAVLKNLLPQEAVEHALQERQLRILSWLPSMHV